MNQPLQHGSLPPEVDGQPEANYHTAASLEIQQEVADGNAMAEKEAKKGCHVFGMKCCGCFEGHQMAIGYNVLGLGA